MKCHDTSRLSLPCVKVHTYLQKMKAFSSLNVVCFLFIASINVDCYKADTLCDVGSISLSVSVVAQLCPTLCDPMNRSTPGLPVHHQLPAFTQTHVHRVSDAIQPSHPLSSPSPPAPIPPSIRVFSNESALHMR